MKDKETRLKILLTLIRCSLTTRGLVTTIPVLLVNRNYKRKFTQRINVNLYPHRLQNSEKKFIYSLTHHTPEPKVPRVTLDVSLGGRVYLYVVTNP